MQARNGHAYPRCHSAGGEEDDEDAAGTQAVFASTLTEENPEVKGRQPLATPPRLEHALTPALAAGVWQDLLVAVCSLFIHIAGRFEVLDRSLRSLLL